MNLNYFAFFLISFVPLLLGFIWYRPNSWILKRMKVQDTIGFTSLKWHHWLVSFLMSGLIVYGFSNLVIHQLGFYELFFTDLMMGKAESKLVVEEILGKYGQKHRSFGHGVYHGFINSIIICLPLVVINTFLDRNGGKAIWVHFSYWMVTSMLVGGLISEFV